jgi:hypothetical protein
MEMANPTRTLQTTAEEMLRSPSCRLRDRHPFVDDSGVERAGSLPAVVSPTSAYLGKASSVVLIRRRRICSQ